MSFQATFAGWNFGLAQRLGWYVYRNGCRSHHVPMHVPVDVSKWPPCCPRRGGGYSFARVPHFIHLAAISIILIEYASPLHAIACFISAYLVLILVSVDGSFISSAIWFLWVFILKVQVNPQDYVCHYRHCSRTLSLDHRNGTTF